MLYPIYSSYYDSCIDQGSIEPKLSVEFEKDQNVQVGLGQVGYSNLVTSWIL